MWRQLDLCKPEVETLRFALNLHRNLLTGEAPEQWHSDRSNLHRLLQETLRDAVGGTYTFDLSEVELINRALRHHTRQLYLDLHQAFESGAAEAMVYSLYDSQQDAFNLLSRFSYYTADS